MTAASRENRSAEHLRLVMETIEAVNSTLDLEQLLQLVAENVAASLAADACFVYLHDPHTDELVLRASVGVHQEALTEPPRLRSGEGITGAAVAQRSPVMIPRSAHLDPRFKYIPGLHEETYESILAVPILAKDILEGALNVRTIKPRDFDDVEVDLIIAIAGQIGQGIENARLYDRAQRRVQELEALARISESVSESLYVEEALDQIVQTAMSALGATGAAIVLDDGTVAWPRGRAGTHALRTPLRWKGSQVGELVCDSDAPFSDEQRNLLTSLAQQAAVALVHGRAVMRGVLAQEIHHRVKNNLQTVASLLRLQARSTDADPRQALEDSVNRILAIAAVHEVLTEQRDESVELSELLQRLRAMIVQGLGSGKTVTASVENVSLPGDAATALALVFTELVQNALEHGGDTVEIGLSAGDDEIVLRVEDDGPGVGSARRGTGLSIAEALVRDELGGTLELVDDQGLRAEVRFPRQ